jgi:hypothetical protein
MYFFIENVEKISLYPIAIQKPDNKKKNNTPYLPKNRTSCKLLPNSDPVISHLK